MAMSLIAILGRQPELGVAELERLLGSESVGRVFGRNFAELTTDDASFAARLGGSTKLCRLLTTLDSTDWPVVERYLIKACAEHQAYVPEGKLTIGLSVYGLRTDKRTLGRTSLNVKKSVKATGRSVRLVPNTELAMNSAQVLHNNLTGPRGWDLCLIRDGNKTHICQTVWSQDIEAYARRDQARPMRDARVGMLPPKLAQIIINLATGDMPLVKNEVVDAHDETYARPFHLLDPFCGTGVVLQEALLMGFNSVLGSDLDPRMVQYSTDNFKWLKQSHRLEDAIVEIWVGDATKMTWKPFDALACETYLGKPFGSSAGKAEIEKERHAVQQLLKAFLKNVARQAKPGTRLCLAVPAWFVGDRPITLPLIDQMPQLGYTYASFRHVPAKGLIYHREGQVVGRQLLVIEKE